MPLIKPSEFFDDKNKKSPLDAAKQDLDNAAPENLETVSEAYNSFKTNLNQVQKLSSFTETLDEFKSGLDRVNSLSEVVEQIEEEIQDLVKKEDLDNAIMSQLLFVEETLKKTQGKIKSLNSKTFLSIKEDFDSLSNLVNNFVSTEVPLYKKLITESEKRVDDRFLSYKNSVNSEVQNINSKVSERVEKIASTLRGINEDALSSIKSSISQVDEKVNLVVEEELPRYKKIFAETELKTEKRLSETERKLQEQSKLFESNYISKVNEIEESLNQFIESEIPKFKNTLVEFKLSTDEKINLVSKNLDDNIQHISENFDVLREVVNSQNLQSSEVLEKNILQVEQFINESKEEISSLSKTYENLYKDFKNREIYESKKLDDYSNRIDEISEKVLDLETSVSKEVSLIKEDIDLTTSEYYDIVKTKVDDFENSISERVKNIEINFIRNESHIENIKESLQDTLSKVQLDVIEKNNKKISKKIEYLESILEAFNEKTILKEDGSLLTGTQNTKTSDPLTPLDKNFVTFDDLSNHYRQFINRVQIQLASIGGGGAGFIKDLDDVSFDQTTGNNQLLIYNQENSRWVGIASTAIGGNIGIQSAGIAIKDNVKIINFIGLGNTFSVNGDTVDVSISGNTGVGGTWTVTSVGIHTTKNVGIATTARSDYSLYVEGDGYFTGNVSVAGTVTYEDVTNVDSIGIITARSDVIIQQNLSVAGVSTFNTSSGVGTVYVGLGSTALYVDGNARITGILTVGRSSVVIDGDNNTITSGIVTITNSTIFLGDNITISGNATGINSAPNVIYVAKDGNDSNNGTSIDNAFLTISSAVGVATTGTIIKVLAGNYLENNPIEVPAFVSIVGDDLKTVTVSPNNASDDIFHVRKGCYIANMTFTNHVSPAAAIGFPTTEIALNVGGGKWESPYIQNCTSNTTTGTGLSITVTNNRL